MKKPGRPSAASLAVVLPEAVTAEAEVTRGNLRSADPPDHLSTDAAGWWRSVTADYDLEPHHLCLLQAAAEAWDRMQGARRAIADHGSITFIDSSGNLKPILPRRSNGTPAPHSLALCASWTSTPALLPNAAARPHFTAIGEDDAG